MFFIVKRRRDFIEGKNNHLPTRRGFIFRDLNRKAEYLWSICFDHRVKKYEATMSDFI